MKKNCFKVGDKVFAKVKGYPPWPAHVIAENGKKYNVEFYGTGETGVIKAEDLFYYLKHKDKFQKPVKRKDYNDALEQIEQAIKEDGGDGDNSFGSEDISEDNESSNTSISFLNTSTKGGRKSFKRKRSIVDKTISDSSPRKKSQKPEESEESISKPEKDIAKEPIVSITNSPSRGEKGEQPSKEIEFIPVDEGVIENAAEEMETVEKPNSNEKSDLSDFKVEVVSEKSLKNNITYAKHVKDRKSMYEGKPVEPREDYISQVLPIKLPSGIMGGIKLHTEWPLKFEFEYDRALYDEAVAIRVLEDKQKIESGNTSIINNPHLFIANIEMSPDDVTEIFYNKEIESKQSRVARLKIESELMGFDSKIKNCLGLDGADPEKAVEYLNSIYKIDFDGLMLIKHPHVVEMVKRLRKYVGNTKEWNLSEEALAMFIVQAEKVRAKAEQVYSKFKNVVKLPDNSTSFWDGFMDVVTQFRLDCKDLTEKQIFVLCARPTSREAFLHNLEEIEAEKENSSGVANSEKDQLKGINNTTTES